jgi:hypothetical protein
MKYSVFLILLVSLPLSQNDLIVKPQTVDKIHIGSDSVEVIKAYQNESVRTESYFNEFHWVRESKIIIALRDGGRMIVDLDSSRVFRITAIGKRFVTDKGIRWGSSFKDIEKAYDKFEIEEGEERGPPYVILDSGIAFELSQNATWRNMDYKEKDVSKFVDSTMTVRSIIVY